ncbi:MULTISPECIES: hypothetical protein [Enterococcus]|uniref:Uncharacterized protein n=1 Tax=Enterococcus alishanensis TaxID=1303817 RepID=A0ABS6TF98_9ENTE|nr:hypothetical protein [Enterococcus alishanensis]MBV7391609.1 hypothetical protein [Enterococcus alishanensis]
MIWGIICATIILYGANIYLFKVYFKEKKIIDQLERLAIMFGTNMGVLLVDSLVIFFGVVLEDSLFLLL